MPVHVFNVGDVLAANDVNTWLAPLAGVKSANQTIISTTTLVNDADMRFAMAANSIYEFRGFVRYSSGTGQDFKMSFTVPASSDARYQCVRQSTGNTFSGNGEFGAADTVASLGTGVGTIVTATLSGVAFTGGTAGNLIFQWSQNTSGAFNTTLYQYSYLTGRKIG